MLFNAVNTNASAPSCEGRAGVQLGCALCATLLAFASYSLCAFPEIFETRSFFSSAALWIQ